MSTRSSLWARGALTTPALSVFLVAVIAVLSYLGMAAPTLLQDGRSATIQRAAASLPPLVQWPSATGPGLPAYDERTGTPTQVALTRLEDLRGEQPQPLRDLLGSPRLVVTIDPRASMATDGATPVPLNRVGLVSDADLATAEVREGRLPETAPEGAPVEVALTEAVAEALEWRIGEQRAWDGAALVLTGIIGRDGRDDGDWEFLGGAAEPMVEIHGGGNRILVAMAFIAPDEHAVFTARVSDTKLAAWMPFDMAGLDSENAATVAAQLRHMAAAPIFIDRHDGTFFDRGMAFNSSLPRAVDTGVARADAMTAVVAVAAVGPIAVGLVVLTLLSSLIARRRVTATRVLEARGASPTFLRTQLGAEGAVLGVSGAAIGAAVAGVIPGWVTAWALLIPALLAAIPAGVVPWVTLRDVARHGRADLGAPTGSGNARVAFEALIVVVTLALSVLVTTRGDIGAVDPLVLALPLLCGATGSIIVLRVLPMLLGVMERRARHRRSVESLLGPARARRDPIVRTAPVLAVVLGVAMAVFAVAFATTVSNGIVRSAGDAVGADVRVDAAYIGDEAAQRVAALDGVTGMATLRGDDSAEAAAGGRTSRIQVFVIDQKQFTAVQEDLPGRLSLPSALADESSDAVPVVVSEALLTRLGIDVGADDSLTVDGTAVRVVGTLPAQVPFGSGDQWIIVDTGNARALGQGSTGQSQLYLDVAADATPAEVGQAAVTLLGGNATFQTPEGRADIYREDPAFLLVQSALAATSLVVAALLAVAVVATLVLGGPARTRMLAILRSLGHPRRHAGRLVAWEITPGVLLALPVGAGVGIALAWLIIPRLDLRGFVGSVAQPAVDLGGGWMLAVIAGFAVITAITVAVATGWALRRDAATVIHADDGQQA